jgi:pimeloyl-ACP methyl ester carboxylesterase
VASVECLPTEPAGHARPKLGSSDSAVVFIHGLHGDARGTWTSTHWLSTDVAWPCLVLNDRDVFRATNVYMADFRSRMGGANPDTTEAARRIAADLQAEGLFAQPITMVAHSMGGIVLARMLTTRGLLTERQRQSIRLVVFLGTPGLPTEAANICAKFGINRQCEEMSNATAMHDLWLSWDALRNRPPAWCVAEGADSWFPRLPTPLLRIVPPASAHRPCRAANMQTIAEGLDHAGVAKPDGIQNRPHRDLRAAFVSCVRPGLGPRERIDERLAAEVSNWFHALVDGLLGLSQARRRDAAIRSRLASEDEVKRFWIRRPPGAPSFAIENYEQLNGRSFALELSKSVEGFLLPAQIQWVRRIDRVSDVLPDSAFGNLAREMREAGGLRQDDVVLALRPLPEFQGMTLLLIRANSSNSPDIPEARAFGLLGWLIVPTPLDGCV